MLRARLNDCILFTPDPSYRAPLLFGFCIFFTAHLTSLALSEVDWLLLPRVLFAFVYDLLLNLHIQKSLFRTHRFRCLLSHFH